MGQTGTYTGRPFWLEGEPSLAELLTESRNKRPSTPVEHYPPQEWNAEERTARAVRAGEFKEVWSLKKWRETA